MAHGNFITAFVLLPSGGSGLLPLSMWESYALTRGQTCIPCIGGRFLTNGPPEVPSFIIKTSLLLSPSIIVQFSILLLFDSITFFPSYILGLVSQVTYIYNGYILSGGWPFYDKMSFFFLPITKFCLKLYFL